MEIKNLIWTISRASKCLDFKSAPNLAKKRTKRRTNFFSPKGAIFLVKSAQFLTPQTIFIAFLCINIFHTSNFAKKNYFFYLSSVFFLVKPPFYCFIKAHKIFSRRHMAFKVAPMCAKAHMFRSSGPTDDCSINITLLHETVCMGFENFWINYKFWNFWMSPYISWFAYNMLSVDIKYPFESN